MKICYFIKSLEMGGAEAPIPRIVRVMRGRGHEVLVVASEPGDRGSVPGLERAGVPYRFLFERRHNPIAVLRAFARLVRQERPDLIWTSLSAATFVGSLVGARQGIPVVSWKHSVSLKLSVALVRRMSVLWVTDSRSVTHYVVDKMRIPVDKVMEWPIYEAIALHARPRPWRAGDVLHIGSAGRFRPQKNYPALVNALIRLLGERPDLKSKIRLTIAGDGPELAGLRDQVRQANLSELIQLPGPVADVQPFLASLHLYVQPSRYEGMCLAVHEAMTAGLPILATSVGEIRESVRASGGGVLLDPEDVVGSLVRELAALADHPERLAPMGARAQAYIAATYNAAEFTTAGNAVIERVEAIVRTRPRRPRAGGAVAS